MYRNDNPWQRPNKEVCDKIPLIFQDFQKAGYSVMYNEDSVTGGVFQYKLNGFINSPADWYPRSYWMAAHGMVAGCGVPPCKCETQEMSGQLKHFTTACEDEAKFSFNVWSNAHDNMNLFHVVEDEMIGKLGYFYLQKLLPIFQPNLNFHNIRTRFGSF